MNNALHLFAIDVEVDWGAWVFHLHRKDNLGSDNNKMKIVFEQTHQENLIASSLSK